MTLSLLRSLAIAMTFVPAAGAAADLRLAAPGPGDLVPTELARDKRVAPAGLDRTPVQFSWRLEPDAEIAAPAPYVRESREYWFETDALAKGVAVRTTAPGAVLRLSPIGDADGRGVALEEIVLRRDGRLWRGPEAAANAATAAEMKRVGPAFPEGTLAFQLEPSLGKGRFNLALASARGRYLVHVFEPASTEVLRFGALADSVHAGRPLALAATFDSASGRRLARVSGLAVSPSGSTQPIAFEADGKGGFRATFTPVVAAPGPGLWEIHAFGASEDGDVIRDAKTAVAVHAPAARFAADARIAREPDGGIAVTLGVDVRAPSRYNASGVLHGTDARGQLRPLAAAHAAQWLDAGRGILTLRFDASAVAGRGLGAPYALRELRLVDQADLGLAERRAEALEFHLD